MSSQSQRNRFCLSGYEVLQLAEWACAIEDHYSKLAGKPQPMDIEWAKDGITGELFILQARPETVQSQKTGNFIENYKLDSTITARRSLRASRSAKRSDTERFTFCSIPNKINNFKAGDILVTSMTDPAWEPIMKRASAIVTDRGGRTCHSAIISRELGLPCIVGTGNATEILKSERKYGFMRRRRTGKYLLRHDSI